MFALGLAVWGVKLRELFKLEDDGRLTYPSVTRRALSGGRMLKRPNQISGQDRLSSSSRDLSGFERCTRCFNDDKRISKSDRFSKSSSDLSGFKRSGSFISNRDKGILDSQKFTIDPSAGSHKKCSKDCQHCKDGILRDNEVTQSDLVTNKLSKIASMPWKDLDSSSKHVKTVRFE